MDKKWEIKDTYLTVKHNLYQKPNSKDKVHYSIVTFCRKGTVIIVALAKQKNLIFIKQYRPAIGKKIINLPGGRIDNEQTPEMAARIELRKETGFIADDFKKIGEVFSNPTRITDKCTIFFVKNAHAYKNKSKKSKEEIAEKGREVKIFNIPKVMKMIKLGEIKDSPSIAAILLAKEKELLNN